VPHSISIPSLMFSHGSGVHFVLFILPADLAVRALQTDRIVYITVFAWVVACFAPFCLSQWILFSVFDSFFYVTILNIPELDLDFQAQLLVSRQPLTLMLKFPVYFTTGSTC